MKHDVETTIVKIFVVSFYISLFIYLMFKQSIDKSFYEVRKHQIEIYEAKHNVSDSIIYKK